MKLNQRQQTIVDGIEIVCKQRNIKLTPQRKAVLTIMLSAGKAMTAYELLDLLKLKEPQAKPPTIYRALEFLLQQDFIHKVESSNSYVICPHFSQPDHISILFICDNCKQITENNSEKLADDLKNLAKQQQFLTKHSVIELHGICYACSSVNHY